MKPAIEPRKRLVPTEPEMPNEVEELSSGIAAAAGPQYHDEDDRDDEHATENEAPVRETDEAMEAPEEFAVDDEDTLGFGDDDPPGDPDSDLDDEDIE